MARTIKAKVPADLVDKIAKAEGIVRGERETRLSFQRRCLALYDVKAGRTSYEATRKDSAIAAREIIRAKLSAYPDHGAGDTSVKHALTGEELSTILDALADQAIALDIARNEITRLKRAAVLDALGALDGETLP